MKKSAILLTLLLLASVAGTYAVYELYVEDRMKEFGEHTTQAKRLDDRLKVLETTFTKTEPQVVLEEWRRSTQPWADAVDNRSRFFTLGNLTPPVEIPEEKIPKIFWKEEIPKRLKSLEDYAADKQVNVGDLNCGARGADSYGQGTNPPVEEIRKNFEDFDYCSGVTRMLIDAKPISISPLEIWPEEEIKIRSGVVKKRTIGVNMQIRAQPLVQFFDSLARSDRYFRVEEFKVYNTNLRETDPVLFLDVVLSQAQYVPSKQAVATAGGGTERAADVDQRLSTLFTNRAGAAGKPKVEEAKPSRWQWIKKRFWPF